MNIESYIRQTEARLKAEKLKENMTLAEQEAFDLGANWLWETFERFTEEVLLNRTSKR